MIYEEARELAEELTFDWYCIEQGWYDSLPAQAIDVLHELIAQKILAAAPKEDE